MSIKSMMPSNHLILCHPLLLLPSIFPSIRVFSNESVGQSIGALASVLPVNIQDLISWFPRPRMKMVSKGEIEGLWGLRLEMVLRKRLIIFPYPSTFHSLAEMLFFRPWCLCCKISVYLRLVPVEWGFGWWVFIQECDLSWPVLSVVPLILITRAKQMRPLCCFLKEVRVWKCLKSQSFSILVLGKMYHFLHSCSPQFCEPRLGGNSWFFDFLLMLYLLVCPCGFIHPRILRQRKKEISP